ncbi:MAG TPA: hypothetical protein ENH10_02815 [Bacteroidetes bacterium]|nr:hypothetical protein [Bacteroidota bacterium]HEX04072.1 hypothetical protein [Bacteroidota bacterium]
MNILCIAPYHVSGTLSLWKREFASRGHRFRYVTMFRSPFGFEEDICLDLPLQPKSEAFIKARTLAYKVLRGHEPDDMPISTRPPVQPSPHPAMQAFFEMRDILLAPRIQSALEQLNLDDADIIWLDQGAEFFRDGRTVRRWAELGKPMMAFYHGSDMRNRGILPQIDKHLNLRLTSEVDLLYLDDRLEYLFLPIDLSDDVYSDEVDQHAHDIYVVDDPKAGDTLGTKFPPELMSDEPSRLDKQGTRRTRAGQTSSNGTSQEKLIRIGHAARVRSN